MLIEHTSDDTFTITRFRDGDTCEGWLECGHCRAGHRDVIRLLRIESWELKSGDGAKARQAAEQLTNHFRGKSGRLSSRRIRRDKYGRILADLYIAGESLAGTIVAMNLAWWGVREPAPADLGSPILANGNPIVADLLA